MFIFPCGCLKGNGFAAGPMFSCFSRRGLNHPIGGLDWGFGGSGVSHAPSATARGSNPNPRHHSSPHQVGSPTLAARSWDATPGACEPRSGGSLRHLWQAAEKVAGRDGGMAEDRSQGSKQCLNVGIWNPKLLEANMKRGTNVTKHTNTHTERMLRRVEFGLHSCIIALMVWRGLPRPSRPDLAEVNITTGGFGLPLEDGLLLKPDMVIRHDRTQSMQLHSNRALSTSEKGGAAF